jgi:twitching motility protein PilT
VTLLESLLDAIVRLEGDALVMHVGEKPYVVTTSSAMHAFRGPLAWGQVELSSRILTPDAVLNMVGQILPVDQRHALEEVGAVEHPIDSPAGVADRFTVVAARGGDDIWLEVRRHPALVERDTYVALENRSSETAAAATPETPSTAVGLQEPPSNGQDPTHSAVTSRAPLEPSESAGGVTSTDVQNPAPASASKRSGIEERVPVLDEVTLHDTEHVERILIPLQEGESETGSAATDGALEIVEPEAQHSPTQEDVESILAATAAALLSASMTSDPAGLGSEFTHVTDGGVPEQPFEVVTEDSELAEQSEFDEDSVDLTAALDEMPAVSWSPAQTEGPASQAVAEHVDAAAPEPMKDYETVITPVSAAASPLDVASAAGEPDTLAESDEFAARESVSESEAAAATEETAHQGLPSPQETGIQQIVRPETHDDRDEQDFIQPEIAVEKTASMSAAESTQAVPTQRIAAAASAGTPSGVVAAIGRSGRPERPASGRRVDDESAVEMLRTAADRGASTVYVVAHTKPMIRVDGAISVLDDSTTPTEADIERLVSTLEPHRAAGSSAQAPTEWISEVPQIGRVRCVTFRDHRGPGIIFRLTPARSISADHLNLPPQIRELATLTEGLVLVTGARGSGKSTLLNSFVDLINGSRGEHVIMVETAIGFVHESKRSFVSQREVGDDVAAAATAASAALREDPDVLILEDVKSGDVVKAALQAAESGRVVFLSMTSPSSAAAIEAVANLVPAADRTPLRASLAAVLRAVVAQVLLRKASGGHVAARELLLNSPAVAASIQQGEWSGLGAALQDGAQHGMVRLNDSLAALIKDGTVHGTEVYRRVPDPQGLLSSLARDGIDISFADRLA